MAEINVTLDKGENVVEVHAKRESPVIQVEVIGSGPQGKPGADGYSPTIATEEITGGHRLTIIDKDHPEGQSVDVMDGQDGQNGAPGQDGTDGVSPEVSIGVITGGHSVTITDADHPGGQTFNVMDGQNGADGQDGADGADGADGVSPEVTISSITGGHSVTITDADHPGGKTFNIMDGTDGADGNDGNDGVSPEVTIASITGGHSVTITDADHPGGQSFNVMDGVNGTNGTNGIDGDDGVTFTPAVSSSGVISWTNDGGKPNPASVDLVAAVISALPTWQGGNY